MRAAFYRLSFGAALIAAFLTVGAGLLVAWVPVRVTHIHTAGPIARIEIV